MTSRRALAFFLLLAGCSSPLGRVRVTVVFENDTRTQCIRASARGESGTAVNSNPAAIAREGKDTLLIGLGEAPDLLGTVSVTVARFASVDCTGTAISSQTKSAEIVHGAPTAMVEFRFSDGAGDGGVDGGTDAGPGDGGVDAGCNTSACLNTPGPCELGPATGCSGDGGCRFGFRPAQAPCDAGVCNSMGTCISNVCAVLGAGAICDDQLTCTPTSQCMSGVCQGTCAPAPECNLVAQPLTCDLVTPTACALRPTGDFGACGAPGSQCLDGGCLPWLPFTPSNFANTSLANTPYPTAPWSLASPDGGVCDTIIDTSGTAASISQGGCGAPVLTSTVGGDGGVMVITTLGLDVGPAARLHFVGSKAVQLVVIGNASIRGVVSVAPLLGGQQPAGTNPAACAAAVAGVANKDGGGGGGFGAIGGTGGESGGIGGGTTSAMVQPLRGGCPGASGFKVTGSTTPGAGGGAIQLIVSGSLTMVGGVVTASGGGGTGGAADGEGGGGGGSGGLVMIEATNINLTGGAVTANGGGGGEGGETGATADNGALGPIDSASAAAAANGASSGGVGGLGGDATNQAGGNGGNGGGASGGGGGGGAVGVVFIRTPVVANCVRGTGIISGAQPMSFTCN